MSDAYLQTQYLIGCVEADTSRYLGNIIKNLLLLSKPHWIKLILFSRRKSLPFFHQQVAFSLFQRPEKQIFVVQYCHPKWRPITSSVDAIHGIHKVS